MTMVSQIKKASGDKHWLVKNEQGETFGPVDFETLKLWAKDGRLAPTNTLSENTTTWNAVTHYPELEMDWVAEVSLGTFYGPIHKLALEALQKEGSLPADAVAFRRESSTKAASKTQPLSASTSILPPAQQQADNTDALRALERQLDLERQHSQAIMTQLRQVESHAAASEARSEACEKAHHHYAAQSEKAQQHLTTQLDQMNKQLALIHAQLLEKDVELRRTEQRIGSSEKLESLIQTGLTRLEQQQQELHASLTASLSHNERPVAPEPPSSREEPPYVLLNALADLQAHITRHVSDAVAQAEAHLRSDLTQTTAQRETEAAQAQAHLRSDLLSAHDQSSQRLTAEREQTDLLLKTSLIALQTQVIADLRQTFLSGLTQTQERVTSAFAAAQRDSALQATQAVLQATAPLAAQVSQSRQELERFEALLCASHTHTADTVVSAVASLLATSHEALLKKTGDDLAARHDQLFERTHAALLQGREQMMRATGDSQRFAIDYIVRELTTTLTQAFQAGRETLQQTLQSGWAETQQQSATLNALLHELNAAQQRVELELKHALERHLAAAKKTAPERTYVEAEAVEVIPPERPRKKLNLDPDIIDPPPAGKPPPSPAASKGLSMADIEQQAQRELERLGAQGMNIFKRKH